MPTSNDHGHLPPDPDGRRPDPDTRPPEDDDLVLPDLADIQDFGLSDPGRLSGVNLSAGGSASEGDWLPSLPTDGEDGSNLEFVAPAPPGDDDSLFGDDLPAPGAPAPTLHVERAFASDEVPFAEVLPAAEEDSLAEQAGEAFGPVVPGTGWFDAAADEDALPVADAVPDSGVFFRGPGRPAPPAYSEEADLAGELPSSDQSSNILSGLNEPAARGDSSNVRLEHPGLDATLADEPMDLAAAEADRTDPTDDEIAIPAEFAPAAGRPADSDLFARGRTDPPADRDDIFADIGEPALTSATSSIFTDPPAAGPPRTPPTGPADDVLDAVEFSDRPDTQAADSDSLHVPAARAAYDPDPPADPTEAFDAGGLFAPPAGRNKGKGKPPAEPPADPSVVVDWVADSGEQAAYPDERPRPAPRTDRPADTSDPTRGPRKVVVESRPVNRGAAGGVLLGLLLGGGVVGGLSSAGVWPVPKAEPLRAVAPPPNPGGAAVPPAVAPADGKAALAAGDPARAVQALEKAGAATPADKGLLGQARVMARVREAGAAPAADDEALKKARAELEAAAADPDAVKSAEAERAAVRASLYLGLTHELAGDRGKAREVYADARKKFAKSAAVFDAALDRLTATDPDGGKTSARPVPAELLQLLGLLLVADPPAPAEEPAEAGPLFWKAVKSARAGEYDDAVKQIGEAKAAHEKRAKALAGAGLNPLSDPLEQIFPRSCDDLKAYWELRKALYAHPAAGGLIKKEGVTKALDQLAAAEKTATDAVKTAADLKKANEKLTAEKNEMDRMAARLPEEFAAKIAAKEKELAAGYQKQLDRSKAELETATADRKKAADSLAAVAKELRAAKLLDEKADDAAVLAATKAAVARAAVKLDGDAGKMAEQLKDLTTRATKAEEAARAAADERAKLETKYKADAAKLSADREAAEKALKDENAAAVKKVTDGFAAEKKKLSDAHAAELKKMAGPDRAAIEKELTAANEKAMGELRTRQEEQTKKLSEGFAAKLKEQQAAATAAEAKLKEGLEAERKNLTEKHAADLKAMAADKAAAVKKAADDAAAAVRKATDDLAAARKAADAEAVRAKGLELAVAVERERAADLARRLAAVPVAGPGLPAAAAPAREAAVAAARWLDAGITAYRAGRYDEAERALATATGADPAGALGWYFLGATRWAQGERGKATEDFKRGAEAEAARAVPARTIDAAVAPIQGPARDALSAARP